MKNIRTGSDPNGPTIQERLVEPEKFAKTTDTGASTAVNHLGTNSGANLKTSNDPQVIKGGVASDASTVASSALKKRSKAGLSTQLGINV